MNGSSNTTGTNKLEITDKSKLIGTKSDSSCALMKDENDVEVVINNTNQNVDISFELKRPKEPCECDYNPLCLVTVGGVVDEYLSSKICSHTPSSAQLHRELKAFNKECKLMENEHKKKTRSILLSRQFYNIYTQERFRRLCDQFGRVERLDATKATDLRQLIKVDSESIKSYLKDRITVDGDQKESEELYSLVEKYNRGISFEEALIPSSSNNESITTDNNSETLDFCQPVGLQNLGATCYLNSQLQCLSTNLMFLQGLFSWNDQELNSSTGVNAKMIEAISKLQMLLATMVRGPQKIVSTVEFASSLGLENNEMQDPNEFAR